MAERRKMTPSPNEEGYLEAWPQGKIDITFSGTAVRPFMVPHQM